MAESQTTGAGWQERLAAACAVPADYDDEDMSVRQGDVKAALGEIERLRLTLADALLERFP